MEAARAAASTLLNTTSLLPGPLAGKVAFTLFHLPVARSRLRSSQRALLDQAQVGRIAASGGRHAVTYRWGDGSRPVLLVHGWQSRASRLADFVPGLLDRGYSVIAFDAPGHGDAGGRSASILDYRDVVTGLHAQYGTFECVVAHSLGALGAFFGLRSGATTRKVVTISGVCDFDYLVEEFCAELRVRSRLKGRLLEEIRTNLFPDLPPEQVPFSLTDMPPVVASPLLVIHDESDTRIDVSQGRRLAAAFGDRARLVVTSGLGHRRIINDAGVIGCVLDFVDQAPDALDASRLSARSR
ncbi:alpha/beta hydrolase [Streptacidiphilus jiangxiensis]|uniref:Alpha/beta hydrolase family protein n=1 Tax=Streptacidiphilus jiangxiensis TaxID=235985 RepID=A0A1H7ZPW7_STRJI|nr:alpha/beta hydrolase [Streptacidiphilus jiangxiensis]SEM59598.1 Alpha/beta hydrolase family protein [Streptacidiphilus jiangxiensis]